MNMNKPFVIAIDGPAASGKGSLARKLALHLDYDFLDTGALYRRVALKVIESNIEATNHAAIIQMTENFCAELKNSYNDDRLRTDDIGSMASMVAQIPEVRDLLIDFQRNFAEKAVKGAVLDGRDIGTVICPNATIKLFVTAHREKRAERRHKELQSRGVNVKYERVLAEMQERDERDKARLNVHFSSDHNANVIDTTNMTPEAVFEKAMDIIRSSS